MGFDLNHLIMSNRVVTNTDRFFEPNEGMRCIPGRRVKTRVGSRTQPDSFS